MPLFLGHQCWCSADDKTLFPGAKSILIRCVCAGFFFLFFLKPWRNASLACFMFFVWQDIKLHWKPCFFGAIPQSYLRGCAPGFIPQFGSNKTLFHSDYRFFIIFLNIIKMKYLLSTFVKSQSDWSFSQWLLKPRFRNLLKWFTKIILSLLKQRTIL